MSATTDHAADRPDAGGATADAPGWREPVAGGRGDESARPEHAAVAASVGEGGDRGTTVTVPAGRHRRRAWLLLAVGAFQVWLWTTRLYNLASDPTPRTAGFVAVHAVLYAAAFAAAGVLLVLGWRMRREATAADRDDPTTRTPAPGADAPHADSSP